MLIVLPSVKMILNACSCLMSPEISETSHKKLYYCTIFIEAIDLHAIFYKE